MWFKPKKKPSLPKRKPLVDMKTREGKNLVLEVVSYALVWCEFGEYGKLEEDKLNRSLKRMLVIYSEKKKNIPAGEIQLLELKIQQFIRAAKAATQPVAFRHGAEERLKQMLYITEGDES